MEFVYTLEGGAPRVMKLPIGETWNAYAGIPAIVPGSTGLGGVMMAETASCTDAIGVSIDSAPATYASTQSTDGSDIEALVSFIISPLAVYRAKLSGAATENTALPISTVTTADSGGDEVKCSGGTLVAASTDDGLIWGYSGANAGLVRTVEDATTAEATVVVTFHAIAVGDEFLDTTMNRFKNRATLTTNLYQIKYDGTDTGTFTAVDFELRDKSGDGTTNSFAHVMFVDHALAASSL